MEEVKHGGYDATMALSTVDIKNLSEEEVLERLLHFEEAWQLNAKGDKSAPQRIGFIQYFEHGELDEDGYPVNPDIEQLAEKHRIKISKLGTYYHHAQAKLDIIDNDSLDINGDEFKISVRINRLIDIVDDAYETVFRYVRLYDRINHPTYAPPDPENDHSRFFRCTTMDIGKIDGYQELLLGLLNTTYIEEFRRYKEHCCRQIETADGYKTKAWRPVMSISDFVYHVAQKESRFEVWKNLTSKGNATASIKHLNECKDIQFPQIKKDRHTWSFKNGLFSGKEWSKEKGEYICRFYPYAQKQFTKLDPCLVSSKYFDMNFQMSEEGDDWRKIQTPFFQSVLDYQDFEPEVCNWMYVMGGRLCFDVGDMDKWQIVPFLKGIARSGKSTLITKVFKKFYESEDVKTLSNNVERKFGLGSIYDGLMFIAPEVKGDLCLEQAEFQSLVSGEDISIAIKHEKAKSVEWNTPGILGGNEVPNWKDNSGSVLRRMLPWNFGKQVEQADPQLDEKLDTELPNILLKCIRAYLEYSQKYKNKDIWNVVPKYFKTIQTQVAMVTNTLQNFLASEKVKMGPDLFCPQKLFTSEFFQHCTENNLGKPKFNPDFYAGPFSTHKLEVRNEAVTHHNTAYARQPVIYGVDLVSDSVHTFSGDM